MITIVKIRRKDSTKLAGLGNPIVQVKDKNGKEYTVEKIIDIIKTNIDDVESFNQLKSTKKAKVVTCNNDKYIRTIPDNTEDNNLENLPTF